jgi:8-oxo-dGTP pyrophosphatase MutT (NUDIX family)
MSPILPIRHTIRVYGIHIEHGQVLLCEEGFDDKRFTKFPGGGLEYGEGLSDALKREFMEELNAPFRKAELFYINDFFQPSAFDAETQVLSVYYLVHGLEIAHLKPIVEWREGRPYELRFFRKPLAQLVAEDLSFPIDRIVAEKLSALR